MLYNMRMCCVCDTCVHFFTRRDSRVIVYVTAAWRARSLLSVTFARASVHSALNTCSYLAHFSLNNRFNVKVTAELMRWPVASPSYSDETFWFATRSACARRTLPCYFINRCQDNVARGVAKSDAVVKSLGRGKARKIHDGRKASLGADF